MISEKLKRAISAAAGAAGLDAVAVSLEHPENLSHGDFSTNAALVAARREKRDPRELAERLVGVLKKHSLPEVEKIDVAGAGFVNFYLSKDFFGGSIREIIKDGERFGRSSSLKGKKVMVEYTDPNPFKEFHIGHLMSNAIGESIARLMEAEGAEVKRACYQGDVGLHVAKALFGTRKTHPKTAAEWGEAYARGAKAYEENPEAKKEIETLNRNVYERKDASLAELYEEGKKVSLESFEVLYRRLGTKFDYYFFESVTGPLGKKIVEENLDRVFEESEGAIVFPQSKSGLHTRVFLNSQGLPTYEAKELGLNRKKFELEPDLYRSIIITANEQSDYFRVVLRAMSEIFPEIAERTKHLSHGMLRLPSGKMSSRTGSVITAEALLSSVEALVHDKLDDRELMTEEKNKIASAVAVAAVKYSILRQHTGGDIIFDIEKSISFEGDSGPYLQYSYVRAESVLAKAKGSPAAAPAAAGQVGELERLLYRFPEAVERAAEEYEPHYLVTCLTALAGSFNAFYAKNKIIGSDEEKYRLALTRAFSIVMRNGLTLLGIPVPERM